MKLTNKIGLFLALGSAITADANPYTAYWYPKADDIVARYGAAPDKQAFAQQEMSALVASYKTQHPTRFTLPPVKAGETVDAKANAAKLLFEEAVALQMYRSDLEMVLDSWQEQLKRNPILQTKINALQSYLTLIDATIIASI